MSGDRNSNSGDAYGEAEQTGNRRRSEPRPSALMNAFSKDDDRADDHGEVIRHDERSPSGDCGDEQDRIANKLAQFVAAKGVRSAKAKARSQMEANDQGHDHNEEADGAKFAVW